MVAILNIITCCLMIVLNMKSEVSISCDTSYVLSKCIQSLTILDEVSTWTLLDEDLTHLTDQLHLEVPREPLHLKWSHNINRVESENRQELGFDESVVFILSEINTVSTSQTCYTKWICTRQPQEPMATKWEPGLDEQLCSRTRQRVELTRIIIFVSAKEMKIYTERSGERISNRKL